MLLPAKRRRHEREPALDLSEAKPLLPTNPVSGTSASLIPSTVSTSYELSPSPVGGILSQKRTYPCRICHELLSSASNRVRHERNVHKKMPARYKPGRSSKSCPETDAVTATTSQPSSDLLAQHNTPSIAAGSSLFSESSHSSTVVHSMEEEAGCNVTAPGASSISGPSSPAEGSARVLDGELNHQEEMEMDTEPLTTQALPESGSILADHESNFHSSEEEKVDLVEGSDVSLRPEITMSAARPSLSFTITDPDQMVQSDDTEKDANILDSTTNDSFASSSCEYLSELDLQLLPISSPATLSPVAGNDSSESHSELDEILCQTQNSRGATFLHTALPDPTLQAEQEAALQEACFPFLRWLTEPCITHFDVVVKARRVASLSQLQPIRNNLRFLFAILYDQKKLTRVDLKVFVKLACCEGVLTALQQRKVGSARIYAVFLLIKKILCKRVA